MKIKILIFFLPLLLISCTFSATSRKYFDNLQNYSEQEFYIHLTYFRIKYPFINKTLTKEIIQKSTNLISIIIESVKNNVENNYDYIVADYKPKLYMKKWKEDSNDENHPIMEDMYYHKGSLLDLNRIYVEVEYQYNDSLIKRYKSSNSKLVKYGFEIVIRIKNNNNRLIYEGRDLSDNKNSNDPIDFFMDAHLKTYSHQILISELEKIISKLLGTK